MTKTFMLYSQWTMMTRKWRTKMRMKTLWSIQEIKLKNLSGLFSLVAQYFDVSADVDVDVAEAGVADVEAVDGVNAGNVKSRLSVMYQFRSTHLFVFVCRPVSLFVYSSVHCFKCNLDRGVHFFSHISTILFLLFKGRCVFFSSSFFYSRLTVRNENRSLNISFISCNDT